MADMVEVATAVVVVAGVVRAILDGACMVAYGFSLRATVILFEHFLQHVQLL
jgi:hypothetical protein